jgi:tetratricopeptide (TPR) repeat protein
MKESPLEKLREKIEELKKISGRLIVPDFNESEAYIEKFLTLRQEVEELVIELKKLDVPIDPELSRLSEIDGELKKNINSLYKIIKRSNRLKDKSNLYPKEYWWWHIVEIVEEKRKRKLKRIILGSVITIIVLGLIIFIALNYKTPAEEVLETIDQSYKFMMAKKYEEAEKLLKEKIKKYKDKDELYIALGIILEDEGKIKEAEESFKKGLSVSREEERFYLQRALEYKKLGKFDKAKKDIMEVLKKNKNNSNALYILATIYEEENNIIDAIKTYKIIEDLGDKADPQILVMAKVRLSVLLQKVTLPQK